MKQNVLRRLCLLLTVIMIVCPAMIWISGMDVSAAYSMCPMCGGTGHRSITIMQTQTIGYNSVTGMPQTIMVPYTTSYPCSSCGGSGRIYSYSGSSSSSSSSSSSYTSSSTADDSVKYGTVIDATQGVVSSECGPNLLDGKTETKFNVLATSAYIIWKAPKMLRVTSYSVTTANDTSIYTGRNPKTWELYGSNKKLSRNDKGWKKIHSVKNDKKLKPVDFKKYTYKLKKIAKPYQYYKLEIKSNKGADCTQLSEFRLKGKTVTVKKTTFSVAKKKGAKLTLKWKKVKGATGYQVQYSTASKFKNSKKEDLKGASKISKTIKNINAGKTYYVRVRAYKKVNGGTVYSGWSAKRKLT